MATILKRVKGKLVLSAELPKLADQTIYLQPEDIDDSVWQTFGLEVAAGHTADAGLMGLPTKQKNCALEETLTVEVNASRKFSGRAVICSAGQGKHYSVTLRVDGPDSAPTPIIHECISDGLPKQFAPAFRGKDEFPLSTGAICEFLHKIICKDPVASEPGTLPSKPNPAAPDLDAIEPVATNIASGLEPISGLVVIMGSTGAAKSQITRGFIFHYLKSLKITSRRPHLVTLEDPIEAFAEGKGDCIGGFDYTARQIGIDTDKPKIALRNALQNALRQTPAVFYVGEVRNDSDWAHILRFAATGHLIVTTSHAGSLMEAWDKILKAVDADSPTRRGEVAKVVRALVHLRNVKYVSIDGYGGPTGTSRTVAIPTVWRGTPTGVNSMVTDGLSSILPHNPSAGDPVESSLGRLWCSKQLCDVNSEESCRFTENELGYIRNQALLHDLRGT